MPFTKLFFYLNSPELVVKFQKFLGIEKKILRNDILTATNHDGLNSDNDTGIEDEYIPLSKIKDEFIPQKNGVPKWRNSETFEYQINYKFFYYLFMFGAKLGEEVFYIFFFPFWFWNINGYVGRRLCVFWSIFMYLGQASKDVLKMPRPPSPPVFRLESKYNKEFGMPSTHAMVGVGLPFAIYFLTKDRYLFPSELTLALAILWCSTVSLSRIYLGMHSVLDVLAGLMFVFILMAFSFHFDLLNKIDFYVLRGGYMSLTLSIAIPLFLSFFYPSSYQNWTTARSDTFIILSVCSGSLIAHWLNFNLGHMKRPTEQLGFCGSAYNAESIFYPPSCLHCNSQYLHHKHIRHHSFKSHHTLSDGSSISQLMPMHPPYPVPPLTLQWFLISLARTFLGVIILVAARFIIKYSVMFVLDLFRSEESPTKSVSKKVIVFEIIQKYLTYSTITVIGLSFCPLLFAWIGIERETYFTEL